MKEHETSDLEALLKEKEDQITRFRKSSQEEKRKLEQDISMIFEIQ